MQSQTLANLTIRRGTRTLYKIHLCNNYLNIRFAERYATKRALIVFHLIHSQRAKLNYYYINHMKTKCLAPTNIASYFNNNSLKQNFNFLLIIIIIEKVVVNIL